MYTYHYSQPQSYRFSLDSVLLAQIVAKMESQNLTEEGTVLDLCAGCGVVGFDFAFHIKEMSGKTLLHMEFLEVQREYREHFKSNMQITNSPESYKWLEMNYRDLRQEQFRDRYKVILSNPPYFEKDQGKLSPNQFKNRCRFFLDAEFSEFVAGMTWALAPEGNAYFLLRDLKDHKKNQEREIQSILDREKSILERESLGFKYELTKVADVRGTALMRLSKLLRF